MLVIDDLHWADASTLDALMYFIAGHGDRRLSILATLRNGEVGEGHPLQRWMADVRRMPRVSWLELGPLDYPATGAQLAHVLGAAPHQSLIREVFSHTAGNPYLNRLIVGGLRADSRHLPAQLPPDLRTAVLRSWHGLSPEARELTELMAVGGRPIRAEDLDELVPPSGPRRESLAILREAAAAGIAACDPSRQLWWFHHPLIAEVLGQQIDGQQRSRWHAVFAAHEEKKLSKDDTADFESLAALAHHHDAVGHPAEAYKWTMRAVASINESSGTIEILPLLNRVVELHEILGLDPKGRVALLNRMRAAAADAGALEEELETVETLLEEIDTVERPLDVSELLVREAQLLFFTGREFLSSSRLRRAVQLAGADKQSWQYAMALAELANAEVWLEKPEGQVHASEALRAARRAGNPRALAYAYVANVMASLDNGELARGRELAALGIEAATRTQDFKVMFSAIVWQANVTESYASQTYADFMRAGRGLMASRGSPHVYLATLAGFEAGSYLAIGRWKDCATALRMALGSDPGAMGDVLARLTATQLAVRQGKQSEAAAHLARAEELSAQVSKFMNHKFDDIRAEVYLAAGNPQAAYTTIMRYAQAELPAEYMTENSLPLAARSLADRIEHASDEGLPTAELLALIEDLLLLFPRLNRYEFDTELFKTQMDALNLLFQAELGRARSATENGQQWVGVADACSSATLRWEEAYACWRAVEALLLRGNPQRPLATSMLRRGLELAEELHAWPIKAELMQIAAQARISTLAPVEDEPTPETINLPPFTAREREILGYVATGRTYSEIARSLVISEKTVSTHVSNMLHKTGTANRLELSRFATRMGIGSTELPEQT